MRKVLIVAALTLGLAAGALASDYSYSIGRYEGPFTLQAAATTGNGYTLDTKHSCLLSIHVNWGSATTGTLQCQQATSDAGPWASYSYALAVDTVQHATTLSINEPVGIVRCVFTGNADQAVTVTAYAMPLR